MYGVVLVVILVIMGGAIAYIGDKLGSKVGKKKLSMFGLRPKHTSIIVTIITGILITSLTLGALTLASENVRTALFGMEKLNQQIRATAINLQEVAGQLKQAKTDKAETLLALNQAQTDLQTAMADFTAAETQIAALEATKNNLEQQKAALDQQVMALSDEQMKLQSDIDRLNLLTKRLTEGIQFVREGEILYRSGEVITSMPLDYTENGENVRNDLIKVLTHANQSILDRLNIKEKLEVIWLAQSEFAQAVKYIESSNENMIVRVLAAGNIVYGEPVRAHIELFLNDKVYSEGQLIAIQNYEMNGEGTGESEKIVLGFLKVVNSAAIQKGIIPDPLQGSVGIMNGAQFYDIVHQIDMISGKLRLTAYAADDTNALGPLRLRVKVEKI